MKPLHHKSSQAAHLITPLITLLTACLLDLRERYNDEVRPVEPLLFHQISDKCYSLNGLPQSHLISQNTIQVVVVQRHHPFQTLDLNKRLVLYGGNIT